MTIGDIGPKMQACSERERAFVLAYLQAGQLGSWDASAAARAAGCSDPGPHSSAIRVRGHELLHRERVIEAMDEVARKHFRGLLLPAVVAMGKLIEKGDHPDHAGAVKTTLSRLGIVERSGVDLNISGEVQVNHTDAALEDLRRMLALGVPREKLVEVFGFSGLSRYEKMLSSLPKVIEHTPSPQTGVEDD
jgi:hypothetical protein